MNALVEQFRQNDGYHSMFITSFARGRSERENDHGILSLWRCYAGLDGYCLQYSREKLQRIVRSEQQFYHYGIIELIDVVYGINKNSKEFIYLVDQTVSMLLLEFAKVTGDARLGPIIASRVVSPQFASRIIRFCGSHKNEDFIDEREVRILAMPFRNIVYRPFTAMHQKKIHTVGENSRRYIKIGENRTPPLAPDRIIVGPKAIMDDNNLRMLFPHTLHELSPTVIQSDIPIVSP